MVRAEFKSTLRNFKRNIGRFITLTLIILVSICFVTGVGGISSIVDNSLSEYMNENKIADIIIKSKSATGFNKETRDKLSSYNPFYFFTMDYVTDNQLNTRVYVYDFDKMNVNKIEIEEGRLPCSDYEVLVERYSDTLKEYHIGDSITLFGLEVKVVGICGNPLLLSHDTDVDNINQKKLNQIIYFDDDYCFLPVMDTDCYINVNDNGYNTFSSSYKNLVKTEINNIKSLLGDENFVYLSLEDNKSYVLIEEIVKKISIIITVFPAFFIAVSALVLLTTVSRMIEEERSNIACLMSLGYGQSTVVKRYVLFSLFAWIIGTALGMSTGVIIIPRIVYEAFNVLYYMPKMTNAIELTMGLFAAIIILIVLISISIYVSLKSLKEKPAELLIYKAPIKGRKILLERIPFIWKRLSFKYKSTLRNIFRYRSRLIMTLVSVAGSTLLVMAGCGLFDTAESGGIDLPGISSLGDTISTLSITIVAFAALLCVLVIYNLTNMNIQERNREIATLKVLGYKEGEVRGYIYREVLIMGIMGIVLGIPLGVLFLHIVFTSLEFGSIESIHFFTYLIVFGFVLLFILIVDLLLAKKIDKVDMNDSLKTLE